MPRRELDEIADQAQRRLDRIDPGAARHELLEDVVLRRGDHAVGRGALLLGDRVVHGGDRRGHAVDGERDAHAVERDAGEGRLHVGQRVDGHAHAPDFALGARVVGVEPELGRQVEGHVQRVLAVGHQVLEARRWSPRACRSRCTGASSTAGRGTCAGGCRACTDTRRAGRCRAAASRPARSSGPYTGLTGMPAWSFTSLIVCLQLDGDECSVRGRLGRGPRPCQMASPAWTRRMARCRKLTSGSRTPVPRGASQ